MPQRQLVLASASPARLRLLRSAGLDPTVVVSGVDEVDVPPGEPRATALLLAERKALSVSRHVEDALVVGCDSLLDVDGDACGKPGTAEAAVAQWQRIRGRSATLVTGHCVIDAATGACASDVAATVVRFASPTDAEIEAYVASGEPLSVAGGFTLDGRSAPFVTGVDGDPGNVIGISLPLLRALLGELDVAITALWS